jgi:transcriptional antiterminator NusG
VESALIADKLKAALKGIQDIYSLLHYGSNEKDVVMRESERLYWERLFGQDFCIAGSVGFIEGDRIQVTSGALMGLEGQIKRINRHKREAVVEMEMMGAKRDVVLMLEVVRVV